MKRTLQRVILLVFGLVCLCSSMYVAHTAHPTVQNKNASQGNRDSGALYAKNCATCHGHDGQAKTFKAKLNHARNLADPKWQASVTDERLFNSISNGKGKMPAWGKKYSEAEIDALVAYVRNLKK